MYTIDNFKADFTSNSGNEKNHESGLPYSLNFLDCDGGQIWIKIKNLN